MRLSKRIWVKVLNWLWIIFTAIKSAGIAAPVFRLANYIGSALVGAAFLAVLPRTEVRVVTNMGRKTMYG